MTFKDETWDERFKSMGDQAEGEFETRHQNWARFGFNRPDIDMSKNSAVLNSAPDYVYGPNGRNVMVEVQGCGKDQLFKFKDDKLVALKQWKTFTGMDVFLWLWDASTESAYWISIDNLWIRSLKPLYYGGSHGTFPEGKEYVAFPAGTFEMENGDVG